jgi:hypothetical protein
LIDRVLLAVLSLPVASANVAPATEIDPVPDCVFVVGVNTTEYTVDDVVVSVPIEPPATVMSPTAKFEDASDSVNVTVSVWPDFKVPEPAREMVTVGTTPSTLWADCVTTALWANVALFAAVSLIVPEFNDSESVVIARPSVSVSPETTV